MLLHRCDCVQMVGVPQATFTGWAQRFLGLGYKVAKVPWPQMQEHIGTKIKQVDEVESGLAKQMREKKAKSKPSGSKIIERKLSQVLTQGTLMGDFLVGDMSTYIMSVKEDPATGTYGVCFADTGTHAPWCNTDVVQQERLSLISAPSKTIAFALSLKRS